MRAALVGVGAVVALVATACTSGGSHVTAPTNSTSSVSAAVVRAPAPTSAAPATRIYYADPHSGPRAKGKIFERALDSRHRTGRTVGRGAYAERTLGTTPGAAGTVRWFSKWSGRETLTSPGQRRATLPERPRPHGDSTDQSLCAVAFDGRYYRQRGHHVVAVAGDHVVARYRLPVLRPERWAVRSGWAHRGDHGFIGQIGAFVPLASGHVLAFSWTGVAAAVTDLTTGRTVAIPGYGVVDSATRTAAGDLLVVVDRLTDHDIDLQGYSSQHVLRLSPQLRVVDDIATGMPTHHFFATSTLLPGVGHDAVLAIDDRGADENPYPHFHVWTVDGDHLTPVRTLPERLDLGLAPDDAHHVFVYDQKRIGVLDVDTGAYRRDVRRLDPPRGSDIEAIV